MKSIYKYIFTVVALFAVTATFGQSVHDLRLNEMMIKNVDNYADEYGRHVPWVEIFNTAYNTVNITGCYLTDDTTGLAAAGKKGGEVPARWYRIPTDQKMYMPQRSFLIFYLDDSPLYGPYHASFSPEKSKTHYMRVHTGILQRDGRENLQTGQAQTRRPLRHRHGHHLHGGGVHGTHHDLHHVENLQLCESPQHPKVQSEDRCNARRCDGRKG